MDVISIRGACTHNLKNVSLDLPRGRLIVLTGVSGSGKSSLAFDTLYAEGERRYVESLSVQARQFLERLPRAEVESITGLPPAVAVDQRRLGAASRASVGTVTEAADHLRLLFARTGVPHCPRHGLPLEAKSIAAIADELLRTADGRRVMILAPVQRQATMEETGRLIERLQGEGWRRLCVDGVTMTLDDEAVLERLSGGTHAVEVVVDRLRIRADARERIAGSLETAVTLAQGRVRALDMDSDWTEAWSTRHACPLCDYAAGELEPRSFSETSPYGACPVCHGTGRIRPEEQEGQEEVCPVCAGSGLGILSRSVFLSGGLTYEAASMLPVSQLRERLGGGKASSEAAARILPGLLGRLDCLCSLGLGYLSLLRRAATLSGGEAQRIRLAAQIGTGLSGVLYVLDEPCSGLHPRDCAKLIEELRRLRDQGNTLVVVEHDEDVIRAADLVVDLGPGAGEAGGRVVAVGTPGEIEENAASPTGAWLSGRRRIEVPHPRFIASRARWLRLRGARGRNLKDVTLLLPVGALTVVTGISGSGKSTLVTDTLLPALRQALEGKRARTEALPHDGIDGVEAFDKVVHVDQAAPGRSARANPATYTGAFTPIRELFAQTLTARERGYGAARFSFNVAGGRCEACTGEGVERVHMQFLPDLSVTCGVCGGRRYNRETLECRWKGLSIADVLDLTVDAAKEVFAAVPQVRRSLEALADAGLGYLRLGQDASTLSGGEAQRMKLAAELVREEGGRTLYILDEPTTGLHFEDIGRLVAALRRLTARGNTVLVVEHDLSVAASADWVVDMGPGGGESGGRVVAEGTPAQVAANRCSVTGPWLAAWRRRHA